MSSTQEHFNLKEIIGIKIIPERDAYFVWVDAVPEKRVFFGLIKSRSAKPGGFMDTSSYDETIYTEEELIRYGYKVYSYEERIEERVCEKPVVTVYLSHDIKCTKKFESDKEALEWVERIKKESGLSFEVVIHN